MVLPRINAGRSAVCILEHYSIVRVDCLDFSGGQSFRAECHPGHRLGPAIGAYSYGELTLAANSAWGSLPRFDELISLRQTTELRTCKPCESPVFADFRADALVEPYCRRVPVKNSPLHAPALLSNGDARHRGKQCLARAFAPLLGQDKKVFNVKRGPAQKRGVREKIQRKADWPPAPPREIEVRKSSLTPEPMASKIAHRPEELMCQPLILCQPMNQ